MPFARMRSCPGALAFVVFVGCGSSAPPTPEVAKRADAPPPAPRGTFDSPAYASWSTAESRINDVGKACVWPEARATRSLRASTQEAAEEPEACAAAWRKEAALDPKAVDACHAIVGAKAQWYGGMGVTRTAATERMKEFAAGGRVLAVDLDRDTSSGEGQLLVLQPDELDPEFGQEHAKRATALQSTLARACKRELSAPGDARDCLERLQAIETDVSAYLERNHPAPKRGPFKERSGVVFRSPGCFREADEVRASADRELRTAARDTQSLRSPLLASARDRAGLEACRQPNRSSDCNGVKALVALLDRYAEKEPMRSELSDVVAASQPRLDALADDEAWAQTEHAACASPRSEDACEGVERYLGARPSGAHAAEAKSLIARATPRIRAMAQQRELRERLEAQREAAREAAEERAAAAARARSRASRDDDSGPRCRPQSQWRSSGGEVDTDVIYTDSGGIVLWCQDYSGKGCVERAMNRAGQFTMFDVRRMASGCCCAVMD
jgi:hypothetical protein